MTLATMTLSAALSFFFLILVFRPLELAFPAKPGQRFFRPAFFTDLCFFLGQYLLWGGAVLWLLTHFGYWLTGIVPAGFRHAVAEQPWWLQVVEVVVLSDFFIYWGHRLQHRVGFLWRFHAVHHSAEHLDWLAAHREHPLDTVYTVGLINLPVFLLGFRLEALAGFIAFRGIWAIYIHSNVRLPIGPLRMLVGAPELHHWHHDRDRDAGNYANISPLMDILFGTYRCPDHEPERLGINEPTPRTYLGYLLRPLLPRRRRDRGDMKKANPEIPAASGDLGREECNNHLPGIVSDTPPDPLQIPPSGVSLLPCEVGQVDNQPRQPVCQQ
jgi:sterol desaturase/sphingolipid hydroxylase (fatty acid hydroxylase superfamily)